MVNGKIMKRVIRCAVVAFALATGFDCPAKAFDEVTDKFIRLFTATYLVSIECDDQFAIDDPQFKREADKAGFDWQMFVPAVHAAMMAGQDGKYDRSKLIPEVTRMVRAVEKQVEDELSRDKATACREWGKVLTTEGIMKRLKWR